MLFKPNIKKLWANHKEEFIKLLYSEQPKPLTGHALTQCYVDKNGIIYRTWESDSMITLERYGRMLEFMQFIAKGLTAKEDEQLDDGIEQALEDGLKNQNKKSAVTIGTILNERKQRRKLCIHTELIYNYLAVQWVRQDENPNVFDNEIHLEKVNTLKEETRDGIVGFFFSQPGLKRLRDLSERSRQDWQQYIDEFQVQTLRLQELLRLLGSESKSKETEQTLIK